MSGESKTSYWYLLFAIPLFGIFVWPGLFHFDEMILNNNKVPIRINRLTGYTEMLLLGVWTPASNSTEKSSLQELSYPEAEKVNGRASVRNGFFSAELYNGSEYCIREITFSIEGHDKKTASTWKREYVKSTNIMPKTKQTATIEVLEGDEISSFSWGIVSVRGEKPKS